MFLLCHSEGYNTYKIALLKVLYQLAHDTYSGVQGHFGVGEKGWDRWLVMWLTCPRRDKGEQANDLRRVHSTNSDQI
jgi:hypothetical protein